MIKKKAKRKKQKGKKNLISQEKQSKKLKNCTVSSV